jgi:hypothetical protein
MTTQELATSIVAFAEYHGFPPKPVNGNYPHAAVLAIEEAAKKLHYDLPDRAWLRVARLRRARSMLGLAKAFARVALGDLS